MIGGSIPLENGAPLTTRTLLLLRHGKSGYPDGVRDHDRPLATRGISEAGLAGRWLRDRGLVPELTLSSSAVRARETAEATGLDAPIHVRPAVYDAVPAEILAEIRSVSDDVTTLLVVGHAPGLPGLAVELAGSGSSDRAIEAARESFTTSTVAVLDVSGSWADLDEGGAVLREVHAAR